MGLFSDLEILRREQEASNQEVEPKVVTQELHWAWMTEKDREYYLNQYDRGAYL